MGGHNQAWDLLALMVEKLGVDGHSSDETDAEDRTYSVRVSILIAWIHFLTLDLNDLVARPSLNCRCLVLGAKTDACGGS